MTSLSIPQEAVKFIAFQRTDALRFPKSITYSVLKRFWPRSLYNLCVSLETKLYSDRISTFYSRDMEQEFNSLHDHLPNDVQCILDIGCGVAGIDALLHKHYSSTQPEIYLIDKSQTESGVFYGFERRGAFYNSLEIAHAMLATNNVPPSKIHLVHATPTNEINIEAEPDLIISLISWGFHYPVETYLERAHTVLKENGCLIIDVRKGTGGVDALRRAFRHLDVISDEEKYERIKAIK